MKPSVQNRALPFAPAARRPPGPAQSPAPAEVLARMPLSLASVAPRLDDVFDTAPATAPAAPAEARVPLTEEELRAFVPAAAARVRAETGMQLDLDQVEIVVATASEIGALQAEDERALGLASPETWAAWLASPLRRKTQALVNEGFMPGVYFPGIKKLAVLREGPAAADPVQQKSTLFHELVHAAQHQAHPSVFEEIAARRRAVRDAPAGDPQRAADVALRATMSLIEGHARFHDEKLKAELGGLQPSNSLLMSVVGTVFQATEAGRAKLAQYHNGKQLFAKLDRPENRDVLGRVFDEPATADLLLRQGGTVSVPVVPGEREAQGRARIERLLALRSDGDDLDIRVEPPADGAPAWTVQIEPRPPAELRQAAAEETARGVTEASGLPVGELRIAEVSQREVAAGALDGMAFLFGERRGAGLTGRALGALQGALVGPLEGSYVARYDPTDRRILVARDHEVWSSKAKAASALHQPVVRAALHDFVPGLAAEHARRRADVVEAREASGRGSAAHTGALDALEGLEALEAVLVASAAASAPSAQPSGPSPVTLGAAAATAALLRTPGAQEQLTGTKLGAVALLRALPAAGLSNVLATGRRVLERPAFLDVLFRREGRVDVPFANTQELLETKHDRPGAPPGQGQRRPPRWDPGRVRPDHAGRCSSPPAARGRGGASRRDVNGFVDVTSVEAILHRACPRRARHSRSNDEIADTLKSGAPGGCFSKISKCGVVLEVAQSAARTPARSAIGARRRGSSPSPTRTRASRSCPSSPP